MIGIIFFAATALPFPRPAAAQAQPSSALAQLDQKGRLVFETLRLEKQLAALGFGLRAARFSIGFDNRLTAYLDPALLKKLSPATDKNSLGALLAQYADAAEKLRQAYANEDFNDVVEYHAKTLLAQDLLARLSKPGPISAGIGGKTIIVRYRSCREPDWGKIYDDLPPCSDALLSYDQGLITDPLAP